MSCHRMNIFLSFTSNYLLFLFLSFFLSVTSASCACACVCVYVCRRRRRRLLCTEKKIATGGGENCARKEVLYILVWLVSVAALSTAPKTCDVLVATVCSYIGPLRAPLPSPLHSRSLSLSLACLRLFLVSSRFSSFGDTTSNITCQLSQVGGD